jgi:hypothetical protein
VTSSRQLGVAFSSARYKRDIREMGNASAGLMKLRPVSFRYKSDPSGTLQYGLVAVEVARVYPELVVHGTDGKLQSVRYLEFTALLLNELQKHSNQLQKQTTQLQTQTKQLRIQDNQLQAQARETQDLTQRLETKDRQLAAQQREIDALKQKDASINFFVNINQHPGIETVHQAGAPNLKRLKDYVAVADNHRFAETPGMLDRVQRIREQPVGERIIG